MPTFNMQILFIIFAVVCFTNVYSGEAPDPRIVQVEECARKYNIDVKLFDELHTNPNFVPPREMYCSAACILKKRDLMDANGKYTKLFEESELAKECTPEYGKDECETAGKLMICLRRNDFVEKVTVNVQ